jgi:hypothetical protein
VARPDGGGASIQRLAGPSDLSYIAGGFPQEAIVDYEKVVSLLGYAGDNEQPVRLILAGNSEVVGVPTSLDTHIAAHEVYLRPLGAEDTEIAVSLGDIQQVELL